MIDLSITNKERAYLRELAKKQLEYSKLPIMKEREELWFRHNDLKGDIPVITFEAGTFEEDILPELKCTSQAARDIEYRINKEILSHEMIGDDRVVHSDFNIDWFINYALFNINIETEYSEDSQGRTLGHQFKHYIKDLQEDIKLLEPTVYHVDRERTLKWKAFVDDIIGDILPVKIGLSCSLGACLSQSIVLLMGMENMIYSLVDYPDEFHQLIGRVTEDYIGLFKWMEKEGLLSLNNRNNWLHQGSCGYTNDLPGSGYSMDKGVTTQDVWGFMDSQETVSISPEMYEEFFFPYYQEVAKNYGLLSYGCCEPVHPIWEKCLSKLPNLRKLSISPWCNEEYMGEVLAGSNVIYHRKPSPNFVGVGKDLDEAAFREHIVKTLKCAKGCKLEFSFRDVYTLEGNKDKPRRAVQIVRELIDEYWK